MNIQKNASPEGGTTAITFAQPPAVEYGPRPTALRRAAPMRIRAEVCRARHDHVRGTRPWPVLRWLLPAGLHQYLRGCLADSSAASGHRAPQPLLGFFLAFFWLFNIVDAARRATFYNEALVGLRPMPAGQYAVPCPPGLACRRCRPDSPGSIAVCPHQVRDVAAVDRKVVAGGNHPGWRVSHLQVRDGTKERQESLIRYPASQSGRNDPRRTARVVPPRVFLWQAAAAIAPPGRTPRIPCIDSSAARGLPFGLD